MTTVESTCPTWAAPPLRGVGRWALVAGATGVTANGLLAGLYTGLFTDTEALLWTGPANDVVGALSSAATVPVVLGLTRHLGGPRHVVVLARVTVAGAGLMVVASGLLVAGVVPLPVQVVVAVPYVAVLFGWLWAAGRSARRSGRLPHRLARSAEVLGRLVVVALPLAGLAALLPQGSVAQYCVGGIALGAGLGGFLGFPLWLVAVGRHATFAA